MYKVQYTKFNIQCSRNITGACKYCPCKYNVQFAGNAAQNLYKAKISKSDELGNQRTRRMHCALCKDRLFQ